MNTNLHWREIEKLREKVHVHANMLAELNGEVEGLPERVTALETLANRLIGIIAAVAFIASSLGALLMKLLGG